MLIDMVNDVEHKAGGAAPPPELVGLDKARIAGDIGREDRGEATFDASWPCGLVDSQSPANSDDRRFARPENRLTVAREGDGCSTCSATAGCPGDAPRATNPRAMRSSIATSSTRTGKERDGGVSRRRSVRC